MPKPRGRRDSESDVGTEEQGTVGTFETLRDEGEHFVHVKQFERAIDSFTKALEMKAGDKTCLVTRSKCYLMLGNSAAALADSEAALENEEEGKGKDIRALCMKAEALYQKGDFESALVFYHRGHKLRPELQEFRLGIQKSQEAINNSIGSPDSVKLEATGDMSFFYKGDEKSKQQKGTYSKPSQVQKREEKKERTKPQDGGTTKTTKQLLGELYNDRAFLEKLYDSLTGHNQETDGTDRYIKDRAVDGLEYLTRRADFWRQQKPMYARARDKKRQKQQQGSATSRGADQDPMQYILVRLEEIDDAQAKGKYEQSLKKSQKTLEKVEAWGDERIKNRPALVANLYSCMGNAYLELGKYKEAIEHHKKDLDIGQKEGIEEADSRALDNLGRTKARMGKYEDAIELWEKKLPKSKSALESTWLFHEIGRCHLELGQNEHAKDYGEKSLAAAMEADDRGWQLHATVLVAQAEVKCDELQAAADSFERGKEIAEELEDTSAQEAIRKALEEVNARIVKGVQAEEDEQQEDEQDGRKSAGSRGSNKSNKSDKQEDKSEDDYEDVFEEDKDKNKDKDKDKDKEKDKDNKGKQRGLKKGHDKKEQPASSKTEEPASVKKEATATDTDNSHAVVAADDSEGKDDADKDAGDEEGKGSSSPKPDDTKNGREQMRRMRPSFRNAHVCSYCWKPQRKSLIEKTDSNFNGRNEATDNALPPTTPGPGILGPNFKTQRPQIVKCTRVVREVPTSQCTSEEFVPIVEISAEQSATRSQLADVPTSRGTVDSEFQVAGYKLLQEGSASLPRQYTNRFSQQLPRPVRAQTYDYYSRSTTARNGLPRKTEVNEPADAAFCKSKKIPRPQTAKLSSRPQTKRDERPHTASDPVCSERKDLKSTIANGTRFGLESGTVIKLDQTSNTFSLPSSTTKSKEQKSQREGSKDSTAPGSNQYHPGPSSPTTTFVSTETITSSNFYPASSLSEPSPAQIVNNGFPKGFFDSSSDDEDVDTSVYRPDDDNNNDENLFRFFGLVPSDTSGESTGGFWSLSSENQLLGQSGVFSAGTTIDETESNPKLSLQHRSRLQTGSDSLYWQDARDRVIDVSRESFRSDTCLGRWVYNSPRDHHDSLPLYDHLDIERGTLRPEVTVSNLSRNYSFASFPELAPSPRDTAHGHEDSGNQRGQSSGSLEPGLQRDAGNRERAGGEESTRGSAAALGNRNNSGGNNVDDALNTRRSSASNREPVSEKGKCCSSRCSARGKKSTNTAKRGGRPANSRKTGFFLTQRVYTQRLQPPLFPHRKVNTRVTTSLKDKSLRRVSSGDTGGFPSNQRSEPKDSKGSRVQPIVSGLSDLEFSIADLRPGTHRSNSTRNTDRKLSDSESQVSVTVTNCSSLDSESDRLPHRPSTGTAHRPQNRYLRTDSAPLPTREEAAAGCASSSGGKTGDRGRAGPGPRPMSSAEAACYRKAQLARRRCGTRLTEKAVSVLC